MTEGFSSEWDAAYRGATHLSIWPWSDMVSWVMRHGRRVLEIGCGAGANIPFFLSTGVEYWAIEGSAAAVALLHDRYPELRERIVVGDFTRTLPGEGDFDMVVDRSSLTHNTSDDMRQGLDLIAHRLRAGGKFIAIDWFSAAHDDATAGSAVDSHTRRDIPSAQFKGLGRVHFSDRDHLCDILAKSGFRIDALEHRIQELILPIPGRRAYWNLAATKASGGG